MTSKLSKYFVSAILLVAVFGFIFVMGQYGIHQSVDKHLLEVNNELGINMFPTIDQTIEAEAASNNGGSNGTVSSFSLNAGSGSYYYTGSIASLSCSDSDSDSYSWWGSCSCSSAAESTKKITFNDYMAEAINSGRIRGILKFTVSVSLSGNTKSAYYSVSGGLTKGTTSMGSGTHTIGASTTEITSNVITIKIWGSASSSKSGGFSGSCSSSVSLSTSAVWLDLYYYNLPVSYSAGSNGSVSSSGTTLTTPTATTASTATANSGYYFSGWTGSFSHANKTLSILSRDYSSSSLSFKANFASIPVSVGTYIYNGSAQGPTASGVTGYSYTYNYNGNANDGSTHNSNSKPTKAGSYTVTVTMKRDSTGETVGSRSRTFTIQKCTPTLSFSAGNTITYGQKVSNVAISGGASMGSTNVAGSCTWDAGNLIPAIGTNHFAATFIPNDKNNYVSSVSTSIAVTSTKGFTVTAVDKNNTGVEQWTDTRNGAVYSTSLTVPISSGEVAQVSVTASPYIAGNYVFLGWMKNDFYVTADETYTYSMANESGTEINAILKAVFVKIDVEGLVNLSYGNFKYDKVYTGMASIFNFLFSLTDNDLYEYSYTPMVYTQGGGFPVAVGTETATFTIRNDYLNLEVFSATIQINIVENIVNVEVDSNSVGYNALTGWGETIYYKLSVPNVTAGKITKYQYCIEGESEWHDVYNLYYPGNPTTTPLNSRGCPVRFMAGENLGDESQVIKYHFKAVNNEDGTTPAYYNGNKSVASTTSYTSCKLDRLNPELSVEVQYQNGDLYSGDWTNGDITFVFTASYGGSGAQINFSNNSTVYENTGATPGYNTGDANIIIENDVFYWTITTEQKSIPYYFKITTGTNKDFTIVNAVTLKIDKTKPVISEPLLNKSPNSNGWIGQETDASFTVSEGEDWSGIVGISVSPAIPLGINSGGAVEKVTNSCILKINDYEQYTITAIDVAGNVQTRTVRYKIDSKTPVLSVEEGSYIENIWVNTSADFNLLAQLGASGAKFFYSYGDDNYFLIGDDVFLYEGDGEAAQQEVRTVFSLSQEMNRNLKFKVETGSNKVAILDFGVVKLDYTPPTIASITDMSYYQNDWRDNPIAVEFYARDDASDIDLSNVTVNNDATVSENGMTIEGFRKFQFEIIKCTVYTVTVYDIAGNAQTYDFWAKIDTVTPSMDYEAYVGSTAEEYYFDKWLNRSIYGDDAYVRFVFYMQISASGAKIQYKDSSEIWKDLTGFLFEEGNESGLIQNVVCEVDVVTEQNGPYMIRLMTGSGKTTPIQDLGTVMIDSTLPYFTAEPVFTDAEDSNTVIEDFQTDWTYKVVKARFIPFDQTSGINSVNVSWYDIDDPGLTNGTPVICQKEADTNYYSFLMDTYAYYELELADGSGNIYRYPVIEAMVDTTDGYSLAVTATKGGEPYISGDWLKSEDDAVDFIFDITFDGASGYTAFGPSGGGVEFSVDDGDTWVTSLDLFDGVQTLVPDPNDPLKASMTVVLQQNNTYRFRVVSGAGRVTTVSEDYLIRKDIVLPEIDYTVMVQGTAYDSSWTAADVLFLFTISVGASNGVIQQTISATEIVDLEDPNLVWTDIIEVTQGYGTTHSYTLENTVDSLYYYFRLVAGTSSKDDASEGKLVRIDKEVITPTFEIYKGEEVFTDDWSDIALTAVLTTLPEIVSGYEVYYAVKEVGETPLESDYEVVTLGAGEENYQTQRTSSERKEIRFRVVNGAGVKFDTSPKIYGIDLITPEFEITFNGEAPKEVNPENPPAVWYLDDVNVLYTVNSNCISGTTNQYAVLQDGVWSGWTSSGIDGDTLILEDTSESGGSIIDIKFRVISGSGRFTQQEYIAHIDDNQYQVNLVQYVGSVEGLSYAEYVNGVTDSKRNGSVNISFKEADGYRLKAVYVGNAYFAQTAMQTEADETNYSGAYEYDYSLLSLGGAEETVSITVGGSNVEVYLYFIKDIVLEYGNLEQYMQNNTVQEIDIWVDEYGFDTNYASENLTFEVSYNGEPVVPNAIGVYDVVVSTENPNFNVVNGDYYTVGEEDIELQLIVRYFTGAGDVFDSYMVSNYEDLTYISSYMNTSSDFAYLGVDIEEAHFRLDNDIELPADFTPLCGSINNAFKGKLYGQNHKIFYDGTYTVYSDFGLFIYVTGGEINTLGVEYNINAQIQGEANISLLIAEGLEAMLGHCYVYGDITINGGEVNCGGLIGKMTVGMMLGCFADVHLDIKNSVGSFGGIVGNMYIDETAISIVADTYSVSQIAIDNSDIHATRTTDYYVGAYLGYLNLPFSEESIQDCIEKMVSPNNYYLNNSVFNKESGSDGVEEIVIDIGIGNENVASDYSIYLDYRSFIESDTYFGAEDLPIIDGLYVGALARMRIQDAGFGDNEGTEASPFSITDYSKLDYIKVFPWAYFKQTADIILPDDYAALATLVPLMGTYNGDGYDIRCGTVEFEDAYGGLFGLVYEGTLTNIKIVGINISHTASTDIYLGGLVGVGKNATISNVVLSGTITVNAALYNVYVGGLVGSLTASVMSDCVSMVNITVTNASSAYVGGIIAQAQNATGVNNIVSLSKITVNFSNNGFVGSSIGTAFDQGVTGQKVYNVEGSTYVNGRIYDATIDSNQGNVQEIYKRSYNDTVGVASGIMLGEKSILELIADLYPFESGTGTMMDPFRIVNYNQLLKIGSYMYANFVIENDIVIGDVDGDSNNNGVADGKEPDGVPTPDGKLDSFDEYDYSFQSLGKGTVFTGSISGGYHSITGLTEPLFEANNGTISELTLNLSYRQYASANSVPVGISGAKVDASGKDVIYGGVAKYNYPNGKMNSVTVGGTVIIQTAGKAKVKAGGIVGIAYGGSIIGCLNAVDMRINSLLADVGGIAGTLQGNTVMTGSTSGSFTFGYNYTVASIRVNGGSVKAGLVVGAVRFQNLDLEVEAADTSAHVYINGVDKGSERLIGYNIN